MGKPYGDLPHHDPTRLTDSAEAYTAPSEAAQQFALVIHDSFIRTTDFELSMNRIAMMFDAFAAQAVAAERERIITDLQGQVEYWGNHTNPNAQAITATYEAAIDVVKAE
jgi:hypothetical protein